MPATLAVLMLLIEFGFTRHTAIEMTAKYAGNIYGYKDLKPMEIMRKVIAQELALLECETCSHESECQEHVIQREDAIDIPANRISKFN